MNIEFNNIEPIYIQIVNYIKVQIASNKIKEGDKLPSVRELSFKIKVNPNTIQKAYAKLEREGLTFTQRGMGRFVTKNENAIKSLKIDMGQDILSNFIKKMKHLGFDKNEILEMISNEYEQEV